MAQGYAGVPAGPLSAYLGVREGNRRASLEELQGVVGVQGLLAKMQAQQKENQFRTAISQAKTPEEQVKIAAQFGGPEGILKHADRQAQIEATREMGRARLQQAANQLEMQNQFNSARIAGMKNEAERRQADLEWKKIYQQGQLDLQKQLADLKQSQTSGGTGLSGEAAGKIAMADQAVLDIRDTRNILFDKDGKMRRDVVAAMNIPFTAGMPGNADARSAYSKIHNSVAAKLRIETGAAATESEVKGILDRFLPKISDPDSVARDRMDRLEEFMNTTIDQTKGVRLNQLRSRGAQSATGQPSIPTFANEAEAASANLKPGTKIIINGVKGTWQ